MKNIKQLLQDEAENQTAITKLKKEGRALAAIEQPTEEQTARLTAILTTELTVVEEQADAIAADLMMARRLQDDERRQSHPTIAAGVDQATEQPWGPVLHSDATPFMRAEARVAALGEFAIAVRRAMSGEGIDPRLFAGPTGMGTVNPADGGFAVPLEVAAGIEREMFAGGEILSRVDVRSITGDSIAYNVIDETSRVDGSRQGGVLGYWVDQGTAPTASATKLARVEMKLRKVGALGYMTDELVADAAALGGELQAMFVDELTFQTENAIVRGTGAGQPLGILNASAVVSVAKEGGQAAATIQGENITKMVARVPARSQAGAIWFANIDTLPQLAVLTTPVGTGGYAYPYATVVNGQVTLWGKPVIFVEYASTLGTVGDIFVADLRRYRLIRKGGVEQASSIHVRFTQGEQTFRAFYRVDGQPMPRSALTPFKGSATLSPFVTLATRA